MSEKRCQWAGSDPAMCQYHDEEWGVPVHDDRHLFEMLTLEGAQAGLSWAIVLGRREGYRKAFKGFDPAKVARFNDDDRARLLADAGIIRNRAKIAATIDNAQAFLEIQREFGSFEAWIWNLVGGAPRNNTFASLSELPAETETSKALSKELKKRGFRFVGPTIMYAFMQAVGMVNDHEADCYRYDQIVASG
jgi:DNA-3-methyladenine glycosylase I